MHAASFLCVACADGPAAVRLFLRFKYEVLAMAAIECISRKKAVGGNM